MLDIITAGTSIMNNVKEQLLVVTTMDFSPSRTMSPWIMFDVLCILLLSGTGQASARNGYSVWWPQSSPRVVDVPRDIPPETPFFEARAVVLPKYLPPDAASPPASEPPKVHYALVSAKTRGDEVSQDVEDLFLLDPSTGRLSVNGTLHAHGVSEVIVGLEASIEDGPAKPWSLVVRVGAARGSRGCQGGSRRTCFLQRQYELTVPENAPTNTTLEILRPLLSTALCPEQQLLYTVQSANDGSSSPVSVEDGDGRIVLSSPLDWEQASQRIQEITVQCDIIKTSSPASSHTAAVVVRVQDVDDNPPRPQHEKSLFCSTRVLRLDKNVMLDCRINVLDGDSLEANRFKVRLTDDPLGLFTVRMPPTTYFVKNQGQTFLDAEIYPKTSGATFPGPSYSFKVVVEDVDLVAKNVDSKVTFEIEVVNGTVAEEPLQLHPLYNATVSRRAAAFSRVTSAMTSPSSGYHFRQINKETSGTGKQCSWLAVTPRTGIVYVADTKQLGECRKSSVDYNVQVTWSERGSLRLEVYTLHVDLVDDKGEPETEHCGVQCAVQDTARDCIAACGPGSPDGRCHWRNGSVRAHPSREFITCTPDESFCPDGTCDELEALQPVLCPQDCAKHVVGEVLDSTSGRGIHKAVGLCTCATPSTCACYSAGLKPQGRDSVRPNRAPARDVDRTSSRQPATSPDLGPLAVVGVAGPGGITCGSGCAATLLLVTCSTAAAASVAMLTLLKRRRQRRQRQAADAKHKLVEGSRASLTTSAALTAAVPSDYVHDRRTDSQATIEAAALTKDWDPIQVDTKWEFPRENLVFEKTLGEGEFGKVVRAQAKDIRGISGYTTVAVKMLKGNGTIAEEQDLLSEFNVLKEVDHPNVIKLLGACTVKGGALYVIVEYAEHGSLLNVLRHSRDVPVEEIQDMQVTAVCNPTYMAGRGPDENAPPTTLRPRLSQRDLLSYAWQIAKGMAYLTDIKLIHRDLAARNILIAAGNAVKISDFGLSRDVYEGDTYLKRSKGRVPVKWMALESLEDHIYTTKSDVWSYGIVLWEIVTLGATPYPGVSPEHLFQLLKQGYRMFQPENCSDEIYQIMQSCWRSRPNERPSFKELTQRFERILQDSALYLDLNRAQDRDYYNLQFRPPSYPDDEETISLDSVIDDELEYGDMAFAPDSTCRMGEDSLPCQEESVSLLAETMVLADTQQSSSCAVTCLQEGSCPLAPLGAATQV